jgi:hypothetical protein
VRQIRDDGLAAVARIVADQVVEHATLGAEIVYGAGLVHVEVRGAHGDAVAQGPATLGIRLGRGELELRSVELVGDRGKRPPGKQACRRGCGASAQQAAARPMRMQEILLAHVASLWPFVVILSMLACAVCARDLHQR